MHKLRWLAIGFLVAAGQTTGLAQTVQRVIAPDDIFYFRPASSVFGSASIWTNPAGLGRYDAQEVQFIARWAESEFAESWGWAVEYEKLGVGYRVIRNAPYQSYKEWLFGAGVDLGRTSRVGLTYRYFGDGPDYFRHRHSWVIGFQEQGIGPVAFGAVWSNLNRGKVNGSRTETEQRYSIAFRPHGKMLTLSAEMQLSTKTKFRHADFIYHAEWQPKPGLAMTAQVNSERDVEVGVRFSAGFEFLGARARLRKDEDRPIGTLYSGISSLEQGSLRPGRSSRQLVVNLPAQVSENPARPVFGRKGTAFAEVLVSLNRAVADPRIRAVELNHYGTALGMARAQELRQAISALRKAGKTVTCYLDRPGNIGYYTASAANRILIPSVSQVYLIGLRSEQTFYAGTLEKLGVRLEMVKIGSHKTAAEAFSDTLPSEANREQMKRIVDDLFEQLVAGIAEGRQISTDSVRALIDRGPFTSVEAKEAGLVDGFRDPSLFGAESVRRGASLSVREYLRQSQPIDEWDARTIAVVVVEGDITDDSGWGPLPIGDGSATPGSVYRGCREALTDPRLAGVVFRIDSPGGVALASERMWRYAGDLARRKPTAVSVGNTAASGAYHVAMASPMLFAMPAAITGSIGVFGGKADFSRLYEKIDLTHATYSRGKFAEMLTNTRPFTAEERAKYHSHLEQYYDYFVGLVSASRKLPKDSTARLAEGQVWTGREALGNGLISAEGSLCDAIDFVAKQANADHIRIELYPQRRPWFQLPGRGILTSLGSLVGLGQSLLGKDKVEQNPDDGIMARLPYDLTIE